MKSSCEEKDVLSKKRSNIMTMWEYSLFLLDVCEIPIVTERSFKI